MSSYHNTCGLEDTREYEAKAQTQEQVIHKWFLDMFGCEWTPSEVQKHFLPNAPLTSVRRALTNLTAAGVLVKTDKQRTGPYGRPEGVWRLAEPVQLRLIA